MQMPIASTANESFLQRVSDRAVALVDEVIKERFERLSYVEQKSLVDLPTITSYIIHDTTASGKVIQEALARAKAEVFKEIATENLFDALVVNITKDQDLDLMQYIHWRKETEYPHWPRHATLNKSELAKRIVTILGCKFFNWSRSVMEK